MGVVLSVCIDARNAVDHLTEWDAPSVVSNADNIAIDRNIDLAAKPHNKLVDTVVDDLFQQDIDAVIIVRAISQATDIHARTRPDMFQRGERLNLTFFVICFPRRHLNHPPPVSLYSPPHTPPPPTP